MIKCIAIDMDGTLLNSTHQITEENATAIKKAQNQGIEVIIATGRSYLEAVDVLNEANIHCPIICVNGAEVRSENKQVIATNPLEKEIAKEVMETLMGLGIYVEAFTNSGIYTTNIEQGLKVFEDVMASANNDLDVDRVQEIVKERLQFLKKVESYDFLLQEEEYHILKLLAFSSDGKKLEQGKQHLGSIKGIAMSSSGEENIEINSLKAQKGVALEEFVKEKGIALMETMAIGDNYNDLSMFQRVGRSVAMGNADDAIKAQCDFVTAINEESGVGKAILEVLPD